ncbi:hypothetical protein LAJ61_04550 [Moraxella osloensis]|nr:hypothetical protein [Moraxella osloensis]UAY37933.1 hypothetical protein LAJ61_04550 [Moraxella osloensis]
MSLYIGVNKLAEMKQLEEEGFAHYQQVFSHLNQVLKDKGLPTYREPDEPIAEKSRAPLKSFPYLWLHYLRWVEVQISHNPQTRLTPINDDELRANLQDVDYVDFMDDPLINHADNEGYYLPVDFDEVLYDKAQNQDIGSSQQLMAVLQDIASYLGIQLVDGQLSDPEMTRLSQIIDSQQDFYREIAVWVALFEASRLSIKYQTAIVFD